MDFDDFLPPRGSQNDQKCSPRGSKRPFFFMLIFHIDFGALWNRFGLIFGSILGPKIDQKIDPKNDQNFVAKKAQTKTFPSKNGKRAKGEGASKTF